MDKPLDLPQEPAPIKPIKKKGRGKRSRPTSKQRKMTRLDFETGLGGNWGMQDKDSFRTNGIWITEVSRKSKILIHMKTKQKFKARTWRQIARMVRPDLQEVKGGVWH